jgi:hypothetical protein
LEDKHDNSRVFAAASSICSPRMKAHRPSQRQRPERLGDAASPVAASMPSGNPGVLADCFDPAYRALRASILSLARDSHQLLKQTAPDYTQPSSPTVGNVLGRLDQLGLELGRGELLPITRWAEALKSRLVARTDCENG